MWGKTFKYVNLVKNCSTFDLTRLKFSRVQVYATQGYHRSGKVGSLEKSFGNIKSRYTLKNIYFENSWILKVSEMLTIVVLLCVRVNNRRHYQVLFEIQVNITWCLGSEKIVSLKFHMLLFESLKTSHKHILLYLSPFSAPQSKHM